MQNSQGSEQVLTNNAAKKWFLATGQIYKYERDAQRDISAGTGTGTFAVRAASAEEAKALIEASPEFVDPLVVMLSPVEEFTGSVIPGTETNLEQVDSDVNFLYLFVTDAQA